MDTVSLLIRMTGVLALVLGLMFLIVLFLKRWGAMTGTSGTGYIQILENRPLLPKRHLSLVRVAGTYFLIGSTEQGMSLLGKMDNAEMERFEQMVGEGIAKVQKSREDNL